MFDFAMLAIGGADEADRITAVALNFEVKRERFALNGHQISTLTSKYQAKTTKCMATNEIENGCRLSTEAVLAPNQKRRRVFNRPVVELGTRAMGLCGVLARRRQRARGGTIIETERSRTILPKNCLSESYESWSSFLILLVSLLR
jgi:hypothetical protein